MIPRGTVVVADGRIAAVGAAVTVTAGAEVIDGAGATLLPGFIDSHTHTFGDDLARAVVFGVTTELAMFGDPAFGRAMREEQAKTGAPERADLLSAGTMATAPGGHGTQFGFEVPTLTRPEEAQGWVDARIAEGSDYIKIVSEDGSNYGRNLTPLNRETITALVEAAHRRGKLAVVHATVQNRAREAVEAGADGLVHIFHDRAPEPGFAPLVAAKKAFVVPTLTVLESATGVASGASLTEDPRLAPYLEPGEVQNLNRSLRGRPGADKELPYAFAAVRQLKEAGVPILAGADTPNPGTAHGASLHRELELLVAAGLTPIEALTAATAAPAQAFRLPDRGRIAPGLRADLVLVEGDPTRDVTATRDILRIWKAGRPVERPKSSRPMRPARPGSPVPGLVSDFEGGDLATRFGYGWDDFTDRMSSGRSEIHKEVVSGGVQGGKALEVSGEVRTGFGEPWAGAIFFPGPRPMAAADLSKIKEISFWARGDGGTYQLLVFATHLGSRSADKSFVAGPEWTSYSFPLADFGLDGSDVTGIFWGRAPDLGPFRFRIDDVLLTPK